MQSASHVDYINFFCVCFPYKTIFQTTLQFPSLVASVAASPGIQKLIQFVRFLAMLQEEPRGVVFTAVGAEIILHADVNFGCLTVMMLRNHIYFFLSIPVSFIRLWGYFLFMIFRALALASKATVSRMLQGTFVKGVPHSRGSSNTRRKTRIYNTNGKGSEDSSITSGMS